MDYKQLSQILKVVAEPNRLEILDILSCGEMCACDLLEHFSFTQPTLSHHMKLLEKAELVNTRKDSKWRYYSLNGNNIKHLIEQLTITFSNSEKCVCHQYKK